LKSDIGGAWYDIEICQPLYNPSRSLLLSTIMNIKMKKNDYVIVLFSGHGEQKRETIIGINEKDERIKESELKGIASRQLTIFDCCRVFQKQQLREDIFSKSMMNFSSSDEITNIIRKKYDDRIMQSIAQQATLYSCSTGQSSYDTNNGAVYLNNLLKAAKSNSDKEFMTVGVAHQQAVNPTYEYSLSVGQGPQNPDASLPKCFTEQQLIISINQP
jgi:hypothetical protein